MIPVEILQKRREKVAAQLPISAVAVFLSGEQLLRNSDVEYPFRQESNFWYVTGFEEPGAAFLIYKNRLGEITEILYVQPKEPEKEVWTGVRAGVVGAKEIAGIGEVKLWSDLESDWEKLIQGREAIYLDHDGYSYQELRKRLVAKRNCMSATSLIRPLRLYKELWEVEQMQLANTIAIGAHQSAIKKMRARIEQKEPVFEYQVEADLYHAFRYQGSQWSYPAIVAGGNNACTLHYIKNESLLNKGDLLLIDAGCEVSGYAADITRCYPVSGKFSSAQKAVYEVVLRAQLAAIEEITRPGATMRSFHEVTVKVLTEGLIDLGILKGSIEDNLQQRSYCPYFMHGAGHFLGLDVHDIGNYKDEKGQRVDIILEPNMVVTVEPGLYFAATDESVPAEFRGIGIRIEDNILKTAAGVLNLTAALPKTVTEIEDLLAI